MTILKQKLDDKVKNCLISTENREKIFSEILSSSSELAENAVFILDSGERNVLPKSMTVAENETLSEILNIQKDLSDKQDRTIKLLNKSRDDHNEMILLQQQLIEKANKIEELQKDIKNIVELFKTDNYKKIQLYNIEMIFGFGIIIISLLLYQSLSLLILFFITGTGIIATSYVSKKKIVRISKDIRGSEHG